MKGMTRVKFRSKCSCGVFHITAIYVDMENSLDGNWKRKECGCGKEVHVKLADLKVIPRRILDPVKQQNATRMWKE